MLAFDNCLNRAMCEVFLNQW